MRDSFRRASPKALAQGKARFRDGQRKGTPLNAIMLLAQTPSPLGFLSNPLLMMIVVMGIFYVLLILPQQRRQKQHRAMLAALKTGDKVITNGGIYGTVAGIDEDTVIVRIADQVKIKMLRSAIAQVETGEGTK